MPYLIGSLAAVPAANRQKYLDHLHGAWPMLHGAGASRMVECWGVDVPRGEVNDLQGAVRATADETVVFSWLEWPDRATADAAWRAMQAAPTPVGLAMPFDGSRAIFGGFAPLYVVGSDDSAGYFQGFVLVVPEGNRAAYAAMARDAWLDAMLPHGALGMTEAWGEDVPRGKQTDFYRATLAEAGEVPVFSWIAWPDRATCDAAARAMHAEMEGRECPEMPFDGKRMMWGGFELLFDSARA